MILTWYAFDQRITNVANWALADRIMIVNMA